MLKVRIRAVFNYDLSKIRLYHICAKGEDLTQADPRLHFSGFEQGTGSTVM